MTNALSPSLSLGLSRSSYFVAISLAVPPSIWMPTSVLSVVPGKNVTLSCHIEAFPSSVNYWLRESTGKIIESNDKYTVEQESRDYKTHLTLTIRRLDVLDFGLYTCLVSNKLQAK